MDDFTGRVVLVTGAGRADELCAAVRFLCSTDAGFMTGTTLVLDGGFTAM
jgi:NAD(P)-dependent dehydrogenase (short-subunit alcohol dehydrogenase family)